MRFSDLPAGDVRRDVMRGLAHCADAPMIFALVDLLRLLGVDGLDDPHSADYCAAECGAFLRFAAALADAELELLGAPGEGIFAHSCRPPAAAVVRV